MEGQHMARRDREDSQGFATASLVLGILWLAGFGALLAVIFGHIALARIKRGGGSGRGLAIAGTILGYVGLSSIALLVAAGVILSSSTTTTTPSNGAQPTPTSFVPLLAKGTCPVQQPAQDAPFEQIAEAQVKSRLAVLDSHIEGCARAISYAINDSTRLQPSNQYIGTHWNGGPSGGTGATLTINLPGTTFIGPAVVVYRNSRCQGWNNTCFVANYEMQLPDGTRYLEWGEFELHATPEINEGWATGPFGISGLG